MATKKVAPKAEEQKENIENVSEVLSRSEQFIENNQKKLLYALIAVLVVVVGIVFYSNNILAPKEKEAAELIFKGEAYFAADSFAVAINGDDIDYIGFEAIAKQYGITKTAKLAKTYMGLCYKGMGDYENAVKYLAKANAKDIIATPAIKAALGDCYVELGENAKAAATYMKAAKTHNNVLAPICLMKAARVFEADGKTAQALKAYEIIKNEYPLSQEGSEVDKYIERAKLAK